MYCDNEQRLYNEYTDNSNLIHAEQDGIVSDCKTCCPQQNHRQLKRERLERLAKQVKNQRHDRLNFYQVTENDTEKLNKLGNYHDFIAIRIQ